MKKQNSSLRLLTSSLSMVILTFALTYCEQKQEQAKRDTTEVPGQGISNTNAPTKGERWSEVREKVNKDEKELNSSMRELETKATKGTTKLKKEIHQTTAKIKTDRDKIKSDSLNPEFSNEWDTFVSDSKNKLDSLRRKI